MPGCLNSHPFSYGGDAGTIRPDPQQQRKTNRIVRPEDSPDSVVFVCESRPNSVASESGECLAMMDGRELRSKPTHTLPAQRRR